MAKITLITALKLRFICEISSTKVVIPIIVGVSYRPYTLFFKKFHDKVRCKLHIWALVTVNGFIVIHVLVINALPIADVKGS